MSDSTTSRSRQQSILIVSFALAMCGILAVLNVNRPATTAPGAEAKEKWLNVTGTIPLPGEALRDQIVIFFDGQITLPKVADGMTTEPFTVGPPIPGQFRVGPNFVSLKSNTTLPPNMIFEVMLNANLHGADGKRVNPQQRGLAFGTFIFEPREIWAIEDKPELTILGLRFPAEVSPEELQKHLSVRGENGQDVPFQVERSQGQENVWRLVLQKNTRWPVKITVAKGLMDAGGRFRMEKDRVYPYPPSMAPLSVTVVRWDRFEARVPEIAIGFSKAVSAEELRNHLRVRDLLSGTTVPFNLATSGDQNFHRILLHLQKPTPAKISVEIQEGLSSDGKGTLEKAYSTVLERRPEPLRVVNQWWNYQGKDGLVLYLTTNVDVDSVREFQEHLEFTPPLADMRVEVSNTNRFCVFGGWKSDQTYQIRITAGLKYTGGVTLEQPVVTQTKALRVPSHLAFTQPGKCYFPRRNEFALALESRNVDKVELTLYRMFPSNIAVALSDMREGEAGTQFSEAWSEQIAAMKMDLAQQRDVLVRTPLVTEKLFPKNRKGVFCLSASDQHGTRAMKLVLLTDIGVLSQWQDDELTLFAHDLYSLAPLAGARISVYSTKNQLLGRDWTDEEGMIHLKDLNSALGVPRVAIVEHKSDYTFLELKPREDESHEFDGTLPGYDREKYDAFLYTDRELYRPGEPVHLRWIVRKNYGDAVANVPLLITIVKPNGQNLLSQPAVLSALGTGGLDVPTQKSYATGRYAARLSVPGEEEPIGTYEFNLEEFVPNRIKASVALSEDRMVADKEYEIRVNGQHLFGAPAERQKCEAVVLLRREGWQTKNWKQYRFENDSEYAPNAIPCGEQRTDTSGTAVFRFSYRPPTQATFPLKATVIGRVYELGGRAVAARAEAMVFPSDICLGIAAAPSADKKGVEVSVVAIKSDETPAGVEKVEVTLEKQVWNYYVRRYYSYHESNWSESFHRVDTREVALKDGKGSITFPLGEYSYHRVRVHSPGTPQYSTLTFYSYRGRCEIHDVARPSLIKITFDKEFYTIGDVAQVRVESPFDGKGIVVLQGGEIQRMIPIDIKNNVGVARIKIGRRQFPNVWVEATVIHKVEEGRKQVYPFSSFAAKALRVRNPERELKVSFRSLAKEIRPATDAQFQIQVRSGEGEPVEAELTLAAVDEGIHAITDYQNPDSLAWLCRLRRPDCRQAHYYDKVAYDFEKPAEGGDSAAEEEVGKRIGAVGENWIKPVALWSGVIQTDKNGRARIAMKVPEFNGQLRLVAVACSPKALGSCSSQLLVRRPYILRTNMPRFLLPGDRARCSAILYNQTDSPRKVRASWSFGGVLRGNEGSREIEIAPRGEATFFAELAAGKAVGQGEIRWDAVILDTSGREVEHLKEVAPIPVRPPAAFQSRHEMRVLKPGERQSFRNVKFLDDELAEVELTVGADRLLRLQKALQYVVGYPYGCVEQTTSRLMPLYLLRKAGSVTALALNDEMQIDEYIRAGINRLLSMQTPSGGLGYWPGANSTYPYGSIYGLHFLTLVKNGREFDLPAENWEALRKYVRSLVMDWRDNSPSGLYQRAYAVYVLALGGDLEALQQIERFDDITLPQTARFLLAAALAQNTKDQDRVTLYLSAKPSQPYAVRERDATLISDIRNTAIELMALRQIGGRSEEVSEKANKLIAFLDAHHYGTTQETAFIVSALAGYLSDMASNIERASAKITASGKETEIHGRELYRRTLKGKGAEFVVANTGPTELIVNITTRGVPETIDLAAVSKGINVRRRFYLQQGTEVSSATFRQTGSYVVKLEIDCDDTVKNLIVADLLPAGFEIENPRLNPDALPQQAFPGAVTPTYLEVRDDRLVLAFDALSKGRHQFYYVVNAVTPGAYQYPAVEAECMYDASVRGASAPSSVEIR